MLVQIGPSTLHVMRSSDWRALVTGKDYTAAPGARVVILSDEATNEELLRAVGAISGSASGGTGHGGIPGVPPA